MSAQDWADYLIGGLDAAVQEALARDPLGAIRHYFRLTVQATTSPSARGAGGTCDGMSIIELGTILYVRTPGSKRENFTLLHELAHHLAHVAEELLVWLADRSDPRRALEEVCDRFAAGLLLPPAMIDGVLSGEKPASRHLRGLFGESQASREVCAIALSKRLGCEGFVAIVDRRNWQVTFAARTVDTRPYAWRGDVVPPDHRIRSIGRGSALRAESWWPSPSGERREFYLDADSDDNYVYAILSDADLWDVVKFHGRESAPPKPVFTAQIACRSCGYTGITHRFPCPDCRKPPCPKCGQCECDRRARDSGVCQVCFCQVPRRRLVNGICNDCLKRRPRA